MKDFSVDGGQQNVWWSDYFRVERILLLGKALKFGVIFQKYPLKLKKIEKLMRKFEKKCKFFRTFFNFLAGHKFLIMGKIKNLIWTCYNGGLGGRSSLRQKNFQKICRNW